MPVYSKDKPDCYNLISLDNAHIEHALLTPAPYVNQNAPKGGTLRQGLLTQFNSLNPSYLKVLRQVSFSSSMKACFKAQRTAFKYKHK